MVVSYRPTKLKTIDISIKNGKRIKYYWKSLYLLGPSFTYLDPSQTENAWRVFLDSSIDRLVVYAKQKFQL